MDQTVASRARILWNFCNIIAKLQGAGHNVLLSKQIWQQRRLSTVVARHCVTL